MEEPLWDATETLCAGASTDPVALEAAAVEAAAGPAALGAPWDTTLEFKGLWVYQKVGPKLRAPYMVRIGQDYLEVTFNELWAVLEYSGLLFLGYLQ